MSDTNFGTALNVAVIVLAVIGAIAVLTIIGMALVHTGMMGRLGC